MTRLYEAPAYGPQGACFWADTVDPVPWPRLDGDTRCDVAIIGGGYSGLNAALRLAERGARAIVLEAEHPGWGASGRNGGFCCLGGAKASDAMLRRRFGERGLRDWHATEAAAVDHVDALLSRLDLAVDRHSEGETVLAHSARAWARMQAGFADLKTIHGDGTRLHPPETLRQEGLGGPWHAGLTVPRGFALNPRKYHDGLARSAAKAGARLCADSPVTALDGPPWRLATPNGTVHADRVILATNGYSSEDLPPWLRARTLPVLSTVIVTRTLSRAEQAAQGWASAQMAYDSRLLLHYFRLLPDGRFLFGMRGGLRATAAAQKAISARIRRDFRALFPAWAEVEITHEWSGLVCLMAGLVPFIGPVPGHHGLFAALGYHGNGVAMGSYAGGLAADLALGHRPEGPYPAAMQAVPNRFPLGRYRRALLAPAYWAAERFDL